MRAGKWSVRKQSVKERNRASEDSEEAMTDLPMRFLSWVELFTR